MIVVAVIGILAGVAYPAYTSHVQRAYRAEARAALLEASQYMERYYAAKATYASAALPERLQSVPAGSASASARYALAVASSTATGYSLTATPRPASEEACGVLGINHLGVRTAASTAAGMTAESCWR
jgi:type IV pilus assembly protein PilE